MSGGRRSGAGRSADHAAHFAGLWERPMRSMAAVKVRNAEVQASGLPTKVTSSAYARQRTSGWAAAVAWRAGWMAAAKRRGPMGSPWRTPRALSRGGLSNSASR
ncbi:hypothetical protein CLOM_g3929 [Closterium sp. NIES-68]|nr:hypothetical protein CLOM_g3929 [Closterium sp. NIES-68]GJP63753.1 hypothetical protein CLOP_g20801 [Closterium sp. NIES-67]